MRWAVCVIWVALAGCEEEDFCDPSLHDLTMETTDTHWYEYVDADTYVVGPHGIAVGGSQRYTVSDVDGCGSAWAPGPLLVFGEDPAVATVSTAGRTVDVDGVGPGVVTLTITNQIESLQKAIAVKPIESVRLVADELGEPGAFFVGTPAAKVQLLDVQGQWLVDRGLTVAGDIPQGSAWNELDLAGAAVGVHAVTVIAGVSSWPVTATIVDHIDDITAGAPTQAVPIYGSRDVCFFAHTDGAVVAGVPWTFDYDTSAGRVERPNCVEVWARDKHETQTTVTAHALGLTATTMVTFTP